MAMYYFIFVSFTQNFNAREILYIIKLHGIYVYTHIDIDVIYMIYIMHVIKVKLLIPFFNPEF